MSKEKLSLVEFLIGILILSIVAAIIIPKFTSHKENQTLKNDRLDLKLSDLTSQIIKSLNEKGKKKIALIPFSKLDGNPTKLGAYLSEELITRLFKARLFTIVERKLIKQIIDEHKLNTSGFIDEGTVKEFGRILGVDAICTGTVTDLDSTVKINARIIDTETGSVFAVAGVEILKDKMIRKLL